MGHERVGVLPQSRRWRIVVEELAGAAASQAAVQEVAAATLQCVRDRLSRVQEDRGVQAAFGYVIGLTQSHLDEPGNALIPALDLSDDPSVIDITRDLMRWVEERTESHEYSTLAVRAAADAIAARARLTSRQGQLFEPQSMAADTWRDAASGAVFSEVARLFLASFTGKYLRYFLEREASAVMPSLRARELFEERLQAQVDQLSRHAFESTKIAQSFAAGWYNKHALYSRPAEAEVTGFLAFALGKLRSEFQRQATDAQ